MPPVRFAAADEIIPARPTPRWWKGNLHTHTFWSDGDDFPEMVAEWYRTRDYNFLALSDHNVLAQGMRWMNKSAIVKRGGPAVVDNYLARFGPDWVQTRGADAAMEIRLKPLDEFRALVEQRGKFLMIPADEISDHAEGVPVHINASNIQEVALPVGGQTVREAITNNLRSVEEQAKRAGREILAHLNHPNFGWAVTAEDLAHVVLERHFEVYNGHPIVGHLGDEHRPGVERLWDIANTIRLVDLHAEPLFGIATDDSHNYHGNPGGSHPGRGWVMVRSTHLTPEYIVKAIKAGDCYASSGVSLKEVRYDREERFLELAIEPDGEAQYVTQFIGTLRNVDTTGKDRRRRRWQNPARQERQAAPRKSPLLGSDRAGAQNGERLESALRIHRAGTLRASNRYFHAAAARSLVQRPASAGLDATGRLGVAAESRREGGGVITPPIPTL